MDVPEFVSLGLATLAVGVILLVYMRRRRRAKAEPEKRIGQARRRRFIEVAQEKRLGLPRRNRDCTPEGMGNIVTDEVDTLAEAVERRKRSRRTITYHRDATSWRLNAVDRRQTPGRRREDRL